MSKKNNKTKKKQPKKNRDHKRNKETSNAQMNVLLHCQRTPNAAIQLSRGTQCTHARLFSCRSWSMHTAAVDAQQHARRIGKIRLLRQKWWAGHGKTESWTRRRQSQGHTLSEITGQVGRRLRCALPRHPCISGTKVCTTSLRAIFSAARCTLQCMREDCMGCIT